MYPTEFSTVLKKKSDRICTLAGWLRRWLRLGHISRIDEVIKKNSCKSVCTPIASGVGAKSRQDSDYPIVVICCLWGVRSFSFFLSLCFLFLYFLFFVGGTFICCLFFHHNVILNLPYLNVSDSRLLTCLRTNSTTFDLNSGGCAIFMFELQSNQYWIFISEACTASSIFIWAASSPTAWFTLCSAQYVQVDRKYFE